MDEQDNHLWVNIFGNCEAEIRPLLHLIIPTLQGMYEDQEDLDR